MESISKTTERHTQKEFSFFLLTLPELLSGTLKETMALVDGRISVNVTVVKICQAKNEDIR